MDDRVIDAADRFRLLRSSRNGAEFLDVVEKHLTPVGEVSPATAALLAGVTLFRRLADSVGIANFLQLNLIEAPSIRIEVRSTVRPGPAEEEGNTFLVISGPIPPEVAVVDLTELDRLVDDAAVHVLDYMNRFEEANAMFSFFAIGAINHLIGLNPFTPGFYAVTENDGTPGKFVAVFPATEGQFYLVEFDFRVLVEDDKFAQSLHNERE